MKRKELGYLGEVGKHWRRDQRDLASLRAEVTHLRARESELSLSLARERRLADFLRKILRICNNVSGREPDLYAEVLDIEQLAGTALSSVPDGEGR